MKKLLWIPFLLTACTGTLEELPTLKVGILTEQGKTLSWLENDALRHGRLSEYGTQLHHWNGKELWMTTKDNIYRLQDFQNQRQQALPLAGFDKICQLQLSMNEARTHLAVWNGCDKQGQVILYRNGTVVWKKDLRATNSPVAGFQVTPATMVLNKEQIIISRPNLTSGSELITIQADPNNKGQAIEKFPIQTMAIWDISVHREAVYIATNTGVRRFEGTEIGEAIAPFGTDRVERLWSLRMGDRYFLAAWQKEAAALNGELSIWESGMPKALDRIDQIRDLALTPDGYLYVLTQSKLWRYDTLTWRTQKAWAVNDAVSLAWFVP